MRLLACTAAALLCASPLAYSQRVRYGPGVCGPLDPTHVKIATGTGGQPYPVSSDEVGHVAGIVGASSSRDMLLWASADGEHSYVIPVDSTVRRLRLTATFDGTGGTVTVTGPDGSVTAQGNGIVDTPLNCGRLLSIDAPASGTWQVRLNPSRRFWVVARAASGLSLDAAQFVEPEPRTGSSRLLRIEGQPIAGRAAMLRVSLAAPIASAAFHLVSTDARLIRTLDLAAQDGLEFNGTIQPPDEPFRVMVTGRDESGHPVQRVSRGLFHAEAIEIVPQPDETAAAGSVRPVTFTIRNHGPAVRLSLVAADDSGKVVTVDPPVVDVAAGADSSATVRVTIPADAPAESEVTIRLTATSDLSAPVGGYNSGARTLRVVREQEVD